LTPVAPTEAPPPPRLTERFQAALSLATEVHGGQRRLGTEIPYLAHLLVVTGLVLEDGGGRPLLERIRAEFGDEVAAIVEACSETTEPDDQRSWRERKAAYLAHLPKLNDEGALRVVLADKVHNARSIVRDYRAEGDAMWLEHLAAVRHGLAG
jgi:(p)ppGpp synthase/HD superfamily hydrolase